MQSRPRPAVRGQQRRGVQAREDPTSLLPAPRCRKVGAHRQELLDPPGRVHILGGAGTKPTATQKRRANISGAKRLGGAASPVSDAGRATRRMLPPPVVGLAFGGAPCSPEVSPDAGAKPSNADDDNLLLCPGVLTLHRDVFTLYRDVWLDPRPPPTPDPLRGTR